MLRGARQIFDAKKKELGDRLAKLSQLAQHMNAQDPNDNQIFHKTTGFSSTEPEPLDGVHHKSRADNIPSGDVAVKSLATSVSPMQGFSRRPLSESELEFLSYENREVSDAESRISHAISNSKHHSPISTEGGIGCSVSDRIHSVNSNTFLASRDTSMNASTSPGKTARSERVPEESANVTGNSASNSSIYASASHSYIVSLASSVQALDDSLNDERKLLLISQHQHHSSVAKIAELERTVEHLQAQFQRCESVNQRMMERAQGLESTLHALSVQTMTRDSELHSTQQLVCRTDV